MLAYRKSYRIGEHMEEIEKIILCNVEGLEMGTGETEFTPACLRNLLLQYLSLRNNISLIYLLCGEKMFLKLFSTRIFN